MEWQFHRQEERQANVEDAHETHRESLQTTAMQTLSKVKQSRNTRRGWVFRQLEKTGRDGVDVNKMAKGSRDTSDFVFSLKAVM